MKIKFSVKILFVFSLFLVLVCSCKTKDAKIEEAITNYYRDVSLRAGGGSHNISKIEVLEIKDDKATAVTRGYYKNNSLPEPESGAIQDTLIYNLVKNKYGYKVKSVRQIID